MSNRLFALSLLSGALLGVLSLAAPAARAEDGTWLVRGRLLDLRPANHNTDTPPAYQALGPVAAQSKVFPEVDVTRFLTPNWAAELVLTYPQAHTVTLNGTPIGALKHLPPALLAQYHFAPDATVRPYAGLGLNYTRFMDVKLLDGAVTTDRSSVGPAAQVGADVALGGNWYANLDAKYVQIRTHVKLVADGSTITRLDIDPWLLSVGLGYRF